MSTQDRTGRARSALTEPTDAPPRPDGPPHTGPPHTGPPHTGPPHTGIPPHREPPPPRRRPIGLGLVLIGAGTLWLLTLAGVAIPWDLVVPIALLVVGAFVLVGPKDRTDGLVGLGIVLAVIGLVAPLVPGSTGISAGDRSHRPTTVEAAADGYGLGAGTLTLDLRDLELPTGSTQVDAQVGLGELVVIVPEDVAVTGEARVGMGEVEAFGRTQGGIAPSTDLAELSILGDGAATTTDDPDRTLELDLQVGLGSIEVRR